MTSESSTGGASRPSEAAASRPPRQPIYKRLWAIIGGIGVVLGVVTGVLTLWDRSKSDELPTFTGEVATADGVADFLQFASSQDRDERVRLEISCTPLQGDRCTVAASTSPGNSDLWLFPDEPCDVEPGLWGLCHGAHVLTVLIGDSDAAVTNRDGAGSPVIEGQFYIEPNGHGAYETWITSTILQGLRNA